MTPDEAARLDDHGLSTCPQPRRVGRPKGQTAAATRERILDAAEALFAEGGYEGTSIRDVADAAGVRLAVVSYHFGHKDQLFDTTVRRRAALMNERRMRLMAQACAAVQDRPARLAALVRGYVAPFFEMARGGDPGWRNYATLMGRLANSPRGTNVISRHFDTTARAYIACFMATLPGAEPRAVVDGFMVMVSAMLSICAGTGRAERLLGSGTAPSDPDCLFEDLTSFIVSGFLAMTDPPAEIR